MHDVGLAVVICGIILCGLVYSNILFDVKVPHYLSRKMGHFFGGVAYLMCYLWYDSGVYPLVLSIIFAGILMWANLKRPSTFRGVGGSGRPTKGISEAAFPVAGIFVIGIAWIWLDHAEVALASLLFMAWGDCITGVIRSRIYHKAVKGIEGSICMLVVSMVIGLTLVSPMYIGIIGAMVAVIVEYNCGDVSRVRWLRKVDDNFAIPVVSAIVMLGLMGISGNL